MINADLQSDLHQMVKAHAKTGAIAAFDWDDTCTRGDLGLLIMRTLDAERGTHVYERYCWMCDNVGIDVAYPYCTTVYAGMTEAEMTQLAIRVWDLGRKEGVIVERPWIKDLIAAMWDNDWDVWVVSANPKPFIDVAAANYGIPSERVIAMELRTDDRGVQLPWLIQPAPYRQHKETALAHRAGAPTFAVSDSIADRALLEAAQFSLAIPTHPDGLRDLAVARGWWIAEAH